MSDTIGTPRNHRARKASAVRHGKTDLLPEIDRDLAAANLAKHIRQILDAAPPFTDRQRIELASLLMCDGNGGGPQ